MVSGSLAKKNDYWYIIINLYSDGVRKQKWISTGLKVRGNKKAAESLLLQKRIEYTSLQDSKACSKGLYFDAYMLQWLEDRKYYLAQTTYDGYSSNIRSSIAPYFKELLIPISELKPYHIEGYYKQMLSKGLSPNTILHHHANINMALKAASRQGLIVRNPMDWVNPPRREAFMTIPYSEKECLDLIQAIKGEQLELIIILATIYGLRRSEVLRIQWESIDLEADTLRISHAVTRAMVNHKQVIVTKDMLKRKSSFRTFPLIEPAKTMLLAEWKKRYGDGAYDPNAYVCCKSNGDVIQPDYVSRAFPSMLKKHGMRPIRFHDLRHSCANLLIASKIALIEVQQWLGHSSISTTADIYGHLTFDSKIQSANAIKKS